MKIQVTALTGNVSDFSTKFFNQISALIPDSLLFWVALAALSILFCGFCFLLGHKKREEAKSNLLGIAVGVAIIVNCVMIAQIFRNVFTF